MIMNEPDEKIDMKLIESESENENQSDLEQEKPKDIHSFNLQERVLYRHKTKGVLRAQIIRKTNRYSRIQVLRPNETPIIDFIDVL